MAPKKPKSINELISDFVSDRLLLVVCLSTAMTVIAGAVESFTKFTKLFESNFYTVISLCFFVSLVFLWTLKPIANRRGTNRVVQWRPWISLILLLAYLAGLGNTYYERHLRVTNANLGASTAYPPLQHADLNFVRPNFSGNHHLHLDSFYLNQDMCSFVETNEPLFGAGKSCRTFGYDNATYVAFRSGTSLSPRGNESMIEVLPLLKKRLDGLSRTDLMPYVATVNDLSRIMRERNDIFQQVLFSPTELENMRNSSPSDFATVKQWLLDCVGIQQPVITMVISNSDDKPVTLTHVIYHVSQVGQVKGGVTGPLFPENTYDHSLAHEIGDQPWLLEPVLPIAANSSSTINLRLFSYSSEPGLGWYLTIEAMDSTGDNVISDPFQIIMAK